jgi:hypothetical protein
MLLLMAVLKDGGCLMKIPYMISSYKIPADYRGYITTSVKNILLVK